MSDLRSFDASQLKAFNASALRARGSGETFDPIGSAENIFANQGPDNFTFSPSLDWVIHYIFGGGTGSAGPYSGGGAPQPTKLRDGLTRLMEFWLSGAGAVGDYLKVGGIMFSAPQTEDDTYASRTWSRIPEEVHGPFYPLFGDWILPADPDATVFTVTPNADGSVRVVTEFQYSFDFSDNLNQNDKPQGFVVYMDGSLVGSSEPWVPLWAGPLDWVVSPPGFDETILAMEIRLTCELRSDQ